MTYEGRTNRSTWNVAFWINNEYPYYQVAVKFMKDNPNSKNPYKEFVTECGLSRLRTPDRIAFISNQLNYEELNDMMRKLI